MPKFRLKERRALTTGVLSVVNGYAPIAMKTEFKAKVTGRELGFSQSTRARNPHLFGALGAVDTPKPKQNPGTALVKEPRRHPSRTHRLACVVTLIRVGKGTLDGDNLQAAFKPLRDAIANTLELDDGDSRIEWQYRQIGAGEAETGTIVKIESL